MGERGSDDISEDADFRDLQYKIQCAEDLGRLTSDRLGDKVRVVSGELSAWIDGAAHTAASQAEIDQVSAVCDLVSQIDTVIEQHFPAPEGTLPPIE